MVNRIGVKLKNAIKYLIILMSCIIIGFIMMEIVYLIPNDKMCEHIIESEGDMLDDSNNRNGTVFVGINYTNPDDYTCSIMLSTALVHADAGVKTALLNPHHDLGNENGVFHSVVEQAKTITDGIKDYPQQNYGRYWHGYLVILKPLLYCFNYSQIILLNQIFIICVSVFLINLLGKRFDYKIMITTMILFVILNPFIISISFQLSTAYYVLLLTMISLLVFEKRHWTYIFILSGIMIAFVDFLTYPLIVLGVPLILALILQENTDFMGNLKFIIINSVLFVFGYIGMWAGKWVLASFFTSENIIIDAIQSVKYRTSGDTMIREKSLFNAMKLTLDMMPKFIVVLLFITAIIALALAIIKKRGLKEGKVGLRLSIFMVSLYTFIWFGAVMNHTIMHPHLAFREWAIFIYGVFTMLLLPERTPDCGKK